jgi:hypothetical protein
MLVPLIIKPVRIRFKRLNSGMIGLTFVNHQRKKATVIGPQEFKTLYPNITNKSGTVVMDKTYADDLWERQV